MPESVITLDGHIIDSLILARVFDQILDAGADYEVLEVVIGKTALDTSSARVLVRSSDQATLDSLLDSLIVHGANRDVEVDCLLEPARHNGVLPEGFYASTNLPTAVRIDGSWRAVEPPEMDCAVIVVGDAAMTVPMADVSEGALVVVGTDGVRVQALAKNPDESQFSFMTSDISTEKPKAQLLERVANRMRTATERGGRILAVVGPAVVHTGASPALARLVRSGYVQCLFAGNGFATHDIETALFDTSLGVPMQIRDTPPTPDHANHLRAINRVRAWGSIAAGVKSGGLTSGTMFECVRAGVPFVLAGSVRDDGPLPEVIGDVMAAQRAMREHVAGVQVALMLGSTLHAIATGNLLPATVETFVVDINPAVVTKLADRGTHQAVGIVTDVGLFVRELADSLGA